MKSQRTWLVNGLLVVASLLVGGLCMEIGARFFVDVPAPYPFPPGTASFDSRGFLTLRPGISGTMDNRVDFTAKAFTIDAAGDRRVPCAPVAGAQTKRIYLIGDSQTFGWGLGDEETWASRLQCRLQEAAADGFRVYNLGVPGDNVDQYWERFMEQVVPVLRPGDTAVASMTWNDLVDFYIGRRGLHDILKLAGLRIDESAGDGAMSLAVDPGFDLAARYPVAGQTEMQTNAHLQGAWKERLPTWRYDLYKRTGIFIPSFASAKAFAETMVHVSAAHAFLWPKGRLLYYRFRPPATLSEKLPDNVFLFNFMTLAAMDRLARHRGATFYVQLLPSRLFFDDYYYRAYSRNGVAFPEQNYMAHVARPLCRRFGLRCIDRFAVLKTDRRDAYTFAYDGHYNEAGARRIGDDLAKEILSSAHGQRSVN